MSRGFLFANRIKKLFSLVCVTCTFFCNAQAPGYMGKRIVLTYGLGYSPRFKASAGGFGVNYLQEVGLEYVTKNKYLIGVSGKFYKTSYNNKRAVEFTDIANGYHDTKAPLGYTTIKGLNMTIYMKYFKRNYLAPWGKYFIFGPTLTCFISSYNPTLMYVDTRFNSIAGDPYYFSDFGPTSQPYIRGDLTIGNGRTRIIANRIVIDYGYSINVLAMISTPFFDESDLLGLSDFTVLKSYNYIERVSAQRVRDFNKFNIFCKIGLLL